MSIDKLHFKRQIRSLNKKLYKQTFFKHDLRNSLNNVYSFINDETRKSLLEIKELIKIDPKAYALVKNQLIRDILFIGSECEKFSEIDIEKEYLGLRRVLNDEFINVIRVKPPNIENIIELWDKNRTEIIVFSCHGDTLGLYIEGDNGNCSHISNLDLIDFFKKRSNYTECVILSACESLSLAKLISDSGKNVLAVNKKVDIKTARKFNKYFLQYINNHSLDYSQVYKEAFNYSQEIVKYKGLEDSFAFEFISGNKIG